MIEEAPDLRRELDEMRRRIALHLSIRDQCAGCERCGKRPEISRTIWEDGRDWLFLFHYCEGGSQPTETKALVGEDAERFRADEPAAYEAFARDLHERERKAGKRLVAKWNKSQAHWRERQALLCAVPAAKKTKKTGGRL